LIALALFRANCDVQGASSEWLSISEGFLVPLDDVQDLTPAAEARRAATHEEEIDSPLQAHLRSDLVHVALASRGALQFTFVAIKYRRLLRSALQAELLCQVQAQTAAARSGWYRGYFDAGLKRTEAVVRRCRLTRAPQLYADKARRHGPKASAHI